MALVPWTPPANQIEVWRSPQEREIPWTDQSEWWANDWENANPDESAESSSIFRVALWPKQLAFFESDETFAALVGGIGSGKSHAGVLWEIFRRLTLPGSLGLVVGPARTYLKQTTLRKYFELLEPIRDQVVAKWNISDLHMTFKNGSEVLFYGSDDEHVVQRMRGHEIADFYVDEAALCPATIMDVLPGRLRQKDRAGAPYPYRGRFTTTHDGEDWLFHRFGCDGTSASIGFIEHTSIYENEDLPPEYVRTVEALFSDTEYAKQELLGLHAKFSGLMYPGFDITTHVVDGPLPRFKRVVFGIDWGFHFAPVIALGITDDDQVVIAREWYGQRVTLDQQVQGGLDLCSDLGVKPMRVDCYSDPSRPENAVTFQQKGEGLSFPEYERGHITEGVLEVARLLRVREDGKPGLVVHRSCVWVLKEIRAYRRKEVPGKAQNDPTRFTDEPAPGQLDHAMDAIRYGVRGLAQAAGAINAIGWMSQTNPSCVHCQKRFHFPLSAKTATCPYCGKEQTR